MSRLRLCNHGATDAEAECQRVRTRYPPARPRDLVVFALVIGALSVASILHQIDWAFTLGGMIWFVAWELTRFRLPRNAREFAQRVSRCSQGA